MIFEKGKAYQCILSKSPGYKVGQTYQCQQDEDGKLYMIGSDGFKDYTSNLRSGFALVDKKRKLESVK